MLKKLTSATAINNDQFETKGDATAGIETAPMTYAVTIQGVAALLFHRWDCAAIEAKGKAKKNSKEKKTDNLESYVYRCENGELGMPAANIHMCLVNAAKSKADPRSPRKSAADLCKAILLVTPEVVSFGKLTWDYEDMRRVMVQRQGITRVRPALKAGWSLSFHLTILDPSYADETFVHDVIQSAGRFIGLSDHRPQFGRFGIVSFKQVL